MSEDQENTPVSAWCTERRGKLVLKTPNIVCLKDGSFLLEEIRYECPCGRQTCRIFISQSAFSQHLTRKRKNMAKQKIPFEGYKAKDYVRYRYRDLTREEQKEALVKAKTMMNEVRVDIS